MVVLNIYSLPDVLYSKLQTTTVSMSENNGVICIEPVAQKKGSKRLRGMFADGKLSVDKHLKTMREDRVQFDASFVTSDHHEMDAVDAVEGVNFTWLR